VRSADYIAKLSNEGRLQRHATRYMPACLAEEVFLHPRSCLASTAPEFVVYMSIVCTAKRPYMALVTSVEPQWLADCGSSLCTGAWVRCCGTECCCRGTVDVLCCWIVPQRESTQTCHSLVHPYYTS
jgi:hypothetical protein